MTSTQERDQQIADIERRFTVATVHGPAVDWDRMVAAGSDQFRHYITLRQDARREKKERVT